MNCGTEIVESLKFIEDHLNDQLSLPCIAQNAGYSEYHFARLFKQSMGTSVMEYVKKRRLIRASDAILRGGRIIDVALNSGYMSHSGFTKVFKQEFGFSPSFLKVMKMHMDLMGGKTMDHIFLKQIKKNTTKEELFKILQEEMDKSGIMYKGEDLKETYSFACDVYNGIKRYSGEEYITHLLNTAIILAQMGAEDFVIYAGLLYDAFEKTGQKAYKEERIFEKTREILIQMTTGDAKELDKGENEAAIMIKLAARLHNMRTIEFIDEQKQKIKARETIQLFLPFAERLDNKLAAELNDLSLKFM